MSDLIDKAEALLPCPFCGGEANARVWERDNGDVYAGVECTDCMADNSVAIAWFDSGEKELAEAIAAWNRRAIPARGVGVPTNCRKWDYYPIEMPITKDGHGPAIPGRDEIASITYEVWDRTLGTHASFDNLPDAINEAMRLSLAALAPTDAATQKGGDAHDRRLRSHEASPGVTAGADAAHDAGEADRGDGGAGWVTNRL